ncbi:sulfurtransferase [Pseudomonadales bacterium]|nr:sulfurtransferase [Pseudomonadales bacterium]
MSFTTLITAKELADHPTQGLRILDCRGRLGDPAWGQMAFDQGHIPGAVHADMDRHLATQPNQHGRHPLPSPQAWLAQIQAWGIENQDQVVVYDDAGGSFAGRAWWMMRWLGHLNVAVLDGGLNNWSGSLTEPGGRVEAYSPSQFQAATPLTKLSSAEDVLTLSTTLMNAANSTTEYLIDARALARFAGDEEPIDPVAGHIPGAVCLPFSDNLDDQGFFKAPDDLARRFLALGLERSHKDPAVTIYCGSGVTAIHNILAMRIAGFGEAALYADSWSGWIVDANRPVARGLDK